MMKRQIFLLSLLFLLSLSLGLASGATAGQYEVKKGDTLSSISRKTGVSIRDIQQANELDGTSLKLKQILDIPEKETTASTAANKTKVKPAAYYTVKKGDNLGSIAKKTGTPVKQIIALNKINPKSLKIGQKLILAKAPRKPAKDTVTDEIALNEDEEEDDDDDPAAAGDFANLQKDNQTGAELLGKWNSPDERKLFVKVATGFLGAPYRLGGSTVRGIDCSAFVRKMYQFFDISLPRTAREQYNVGLSVDKNELLEGDLVFFRTRKPVGHVGIYVGNNEFVHASYRDKVIKIDNLETPYFHKRFIRAVRVKGLAEKGT
jgi:cell wall-associated NlpC family hydrolase